MRALDADRDAVNAHMHPFAQQSAIDTADIEDVAAVLIVVGKFVALHASRERARQLVVDILAASVRPPGIAGKLRADGRVRILITRLNAAGRAV